MPKRVILDIDAGTDDAFALLLLLFAEQNKDVEIVAITCVNGNTSVENVYTNVKRLLKICNREEIPVYVGASEPLIPPENNFRLYFHGKDGFGDLDYEDDNLTVKNSSQKQKTEKTIDGDEPTMETTIQQDNNKNFLCESAIVVMQKLVAENPGQISLICLGPLTNAALAMKVYSQFAKNVKEIFIMGGNHKGVGNVTAAAEFNFHVDPEAAYIVLHSAKCPITIVTWEPCLDTKITFDWRYNVLGNLSHPVLSLLNAAEKNIYPENEKVWLPCDAFLIAVFLNPDIIKSSEECNVSVELQGFKTRAQMVIDHMKNKEPNVTVVTQLNEDLFKTMLLETFDYNK